MAPRKGLRLSAVIIGCDPGSRYTGLVVRLRDDVVDHAVLQSLVTRKRALPPASYMREVVAWIRAAKTHVEGYGHEVHIAVEGLVPPGGYARGGERIPLTDPGTHMGLAGVWGGVMDAFPDAIEVRPGGHGEAPLRTYPPELVGERERRGAGILGHARSAWDVAGAAKRTILNPRLAWRTGDP